MAFTQTANLPPYSAIHLKRLGTYAGTGTIEGVTQIDGVEAPCRVTLFDEGGTRVDFIRTGSNGHYLFSQLASGNYTILIEDDMQRDKHPKIVLTSIS